MEPWLKISLILCTFGFFREMRPSEPFVTEFLSGEWRNITSEQVNREVYPLGTYSYLAQLVVIFLITDMLRYKPIIVVSACFGIILWSLLLWTYTLQGLQVVQFFYGTFMAAEVAYYTYMYAKVDKDKYQQVTGHARAGILSGRFLAGVFAQILVSFQLMDLRELNYISFASQIISLFIAFLLPSVGSSLYFYAPKSDYDDQLPAPQIISSIQSTMRNDKIVYNEKILYAAEEGISKQNADNESSTESLNLTKNSPKFSCKRAIQLLWSHLIDAYTNKSVIQWSLWWSLAMCGFLQVQSYVQLLWQAIDPGQENFFNGGVEAILTLLGAFGALAAGFMNSEKFVKWDLFILTVCSAIEGGLILISALTESVFVAYLMYILFGVLYQFMITVASATVAKNLVEDSFALIFGINTLFALIFQTIMTILVISDSGFKLDPRGQFIVFGAYFLVLAVIYGIFGILGLLIRPSNTQSDQVLTTNTSFGSLDDERQR